MRILVTGNLGYIGPVVVKHLKDHLPGATIVGLDTGFFASCITTEDRLLDTYCDEQIYKDIRDLDPAEVSGFDALVLLSAISNDPMGHKFEEVTHEINNQAIGRLLDGFAALPDKCIVFASSCSMYGAGGQMAKSEHDTINPLTAYARSKVAVEEHLQNIELGPRTKATSLRFSTACGMSDRLRLDLVLNDFVASAVINNEVVVLSDGSPWRPLINVKDMARAIEWALVRDLGGDQSFLAINIGSDEWNFTVKQLAEAVVKKIPGAGLSINSDAAPDKRSYKVDFSLFRQLAPDHQPQCTLDATIDELIEGIAPIKALLGSDFRNSPYVRLEKLNHLLRTNQLMPDLRWKQGR